MTTVVIAIVLLYGCAAISRYYVPVDFDSENSDWICLENHPYYTVQIIDGVELNVRTLQSGSTTYIYLVVGIQQESSIDVAEMHAHVQLNGTKPVRVELVLRTWQSEDLETRYGDSYQYFTISTELISGEDRFTLHLPNIVALGKELNVNPIVFEKKSGVSIDVCPSGMAW